MQSLCASQALGRAVARPSASNSTAVGAIRPLLANVRREALSGRPLTACRATDSDAPAPAAAAAPAAGAKPAAAAEDFTDEMVFFEGDVSSNVELALSILLSATLIYAPLTLASIGRKLWIKVKVTNKRIIITNTSPAFKGQTQIAFSKIKEIRTAPRAFGAWGDMVIFLKDGSRLELVGMEKYAEIKRHIESCIID